MDLTDVPLSFRVEYGNGDYADRLGVGWVDVPDASPGRTVSAITKEQAQSLQARYADVMDKAVTKPVSAKDKGKGKTKAPKLPKPKTDKPVGKCSDQEAYDACYRLKRDDITKKMLEDLWLAEVAKVNADEAAITPEQWFEIKERVLKQVSKV
jgi:hypothetical protein